ncbi:transporter substrate-binding domain-containing protein [Paralimibaculum aggregatum]|uniref:Transporter substrate-binding domain-containing protein n=1 Tax=Paralimibaculum aggregatum TaxID=3036245 RepID=A0ABQ6LML1_9RHOB|nr:transporter substrate-binding domain-containing protein [Limibaculum sp. NKW23]GMG81520.1 transporter substrate-binding domain-containing protein [Limibaculum sp. NKW23]
MSKPDSQEPFRIGVLFSETGITAAMERSMLQAVTFAVEEVNATGGIDGRELVMVRYDAGSDPVYYNYLAEQLIVSDGVRVLFGCYRSSTRKAVIPVVERHNALLMYPAQYEGFEYSKNIIYGGAVANQNNAQLGDYLLKNFGARVFIVGSDYIWPREAGRTLSDLISLQKGETVGEVYMSMDVPQESLTELVARIRSAAPDAIFCNLVGPSIGLFYRAYAAAGLDPARMPIASLTTSETDIAAMGAEFAEGHLTSAPYFQSVGTEANLACLARLRAKYGADARTNMCWEAVYSQVHLVAQALRSAGTDNVDVLRRALIGSEFDAPQGRIRIDPETSHTYLWPRIGRADATGTLEVIQDSIRPVKPDPYLTSHQAIDWGMRDVSGGSAG